MQRSRIAQALLFGGGLAAHTAMAASVQLISAKPGATKFIEFETASLTGGILASVQFSVVPKSGSFTRPVAATYSAAYLTARGYLNAAGTQVTVPTFGLYANYTNTINLVFNFSDGSQVPLQASVTTGAFSENCNVFNNMKIALQARQHTGDISYDYLMMKKYCDFEGPTILDTDGNVRWIATDRTISHPAILYGNSIYTSNGTGVNRMDWDGTYVPVADYAGIGVTDSGHHNYEPGRNGIILEVSTANSVESVDLEIDTAGHVLRSWDWVQIISTAMTAGGDNPALFVFPTDLNWFHNNSTLYNPADNTLIASSRENFVIAVDYDSQKIKWILGDPTKAWYGFASLRKYAMKLAKGTNPPEGQHSLSFDHNGNLLLFDDGFHSLVHTPAGGSRTYSTPRAYRLNTALKSAKEVFNYTQNGTVYTTLCGSTYEDAPSNYIIDYPLAQNGAITELVGVGASLQKVFDFQFPAVNLCGTAWNAIQVHMENIAY
jgi:hypothetical protein